MFRTKCAAKLRRQIDRFDVAMFVAERLPDGSDFKLLAINSAYERQSGLSMSQLVDRPLAALLPEAAANTAKAHYTRCITDTPQLRVRELLDLPTGRVFWDTTLHHIRPRNPSAPERIVGNSRVIEQHARDELDKAAFENVRYFAGTSSFKLSQIAGVLDAIEEGRMPPERLAESISYISGLCRTLDVSMQELSLTAQERLSARLDPVREVLAARQVERDGIETAVAAMLDRPADKTDSTGLAPHLMS